ncbi:MAG: hypothetical protein MZV63_03235 [Marinilabiliales bacterium]|nr:hypothetical protein [Marinilabiliales bacterium]
MNWLHPTEKPFEAHIEWAVAIPSVLIGLCWESQLHGLCTEKRQIFPTELAATFRYSYRWAYNKFYIDEVYLFVTKKIIFRYISEPVAWFDRHIVDGTMNAIADSYTGMSHSGSEDFSRVSCRNMLLSLFPE